MADNQLATETKKAISPAIILAIIAVVIVAIVVFAANKSTSEVALNDQVAPVILDTTAIVVNEAAAAPVTEPAPTTTTQVIAYKDGTYTAEGDYTSPAGAEAINVTLTVKDGVVIESVVTAEATNNISKMKQADFIANYQTLVVGKNIADLKLGKVSGASLTPVGFNDAVAKIVAEAKA